MSTATLVLDRSPQPLRSRVPSARHQARRQVYLRRRLAVAAVLVVALALALTVTGRGVQASDGSAPVRAQAVTYVVQPGDTLWTIAASLAPEADPRPIVQELESSAGSPMLTVGQALVIPGALVG